VEGFEEVQLHEGWRFGLMVEYVELGWGCSIGIIVQL